jgi:threonine/homoserine/homoserine lactone efflux protein
MTSHALALAEIWRPVLTLILASAVLMGSPGPTTVSVTAVGAAYGFRRALGYAGGLIAGTAVVLLAVAAGVVAILMSIPHGAPVLVAVSAVYICYLAVKIASAPPLSSTRAPVAAPAFAGGALLGIANPKAYLTIAAVFSGTRVVADDALDAGIKLAVLSAMIVVIHLAWLTAGASLARVLQDPVRSRLVNLAMAAGLVATTVMALL